MSIIYIIHVYTGGIEKVKGDPTGRDVSRRKSIFSSYESANPRRHKHRFRPRTLSLKL